jgi:hypothetical protein
MTVRQNLTIRQSETFSYTYTYNDAGGSPVDLTDYTGVWTIAGWATGTVTLGGAAGTVALSLTSAQTYDLGNESSSGYGAYADHVLSQAGELDYTSSGETIFQRNYTVNLTAPGGDVTRVLEGQCEIIKDVEV